MSTKDHAPLSSFTISGLVVIVVMALSAILLSTGTSSVGSDNVRSISHIKQSAIGLLEYADDNGDRLPFADRWMDLSSPYGPSEPNRFRLFFEGPKRDAGPHFDIAFRTRLSSVSTTSSSAPEQEVMIFESKNDRQNQHGDRELLPDPPRRNGFYVLAFLNGYARTLNPAQAHRAFRGEASVDR